MSAWRREASKRLPEFQSIIASRDIDSPMMLWIELNIEFDSLCRLDPAPIDQLRRIWSYCEWCLEHGSDDVMTAAALAFSEHLIDNKHRIAVLPQIISRSDYLGFKAVLLYHNGEEKYFKVLESFSKHKI